jgi:hypothetical protein
MIDLRNVWATAATELRLSRRLVRYWIFAVLAVFALLLFYGYYAFLHWFASGYSPTAGFLNPRFVISAPAWYLVSLLAIGSVFLGFDLRARDRRERVAEVLDARIHSNADLVLGRFAGLFLAILAPVVLGLLLVALLGLLIGSPVQPLTLVAAIVLLCLPAFTFTLGLTFAVALAVRLRLVAAVIVVALLGASGVLLFRLPLWAGLAFDVVGAYTLPFPSDLAPVFVEANGALQRVGYLLTGLGLLGVATALYPRRDGGRALLRWGASGALVVLGVLAIGATAARHHDTLEQRRAWLAAHRAVEQEPAPDVEALSADVELEPGDALRVDARLTVRGPAAGAIEEALFTLNPGFAVETVELGEGRPLAFSHEDGLLVIELPGRLAREDVVDLRVVYAGAPDRRWGYLDALKDPLALEIGSDAVFFALGQESMIFHPRHVSLLPGAGWLPRPGSDVGRDDPKVRPPDFHRLDLVVELPEGMTPAGPGRREPVPGARSGRQRFRFAPPVPVPAVGLVAGHYGSQSVEIDGVTFEVLLAHEDNLERFRPAADEIEAWLAARLDAARELGLDYPYGALTMVEVPLALRTVGGGWRMGSVLAPPALVLARESGFPTARFGRHMPNEDEEAAAEEAEQDGSGEEADTAPAAVAELSERVKVLVRFFENDFDGGNPFLGAARNVLGYQTAGAGAAGLPLDLVLEHLVVELVTGRSGFFSAHLYSGSINQLLGSALTTHGQRGGSFAQTLERVATERPEVWEEMLEVPLVEIDPAEDPRRAHDVLLLKSRAFARYLLETHGERAIGEMLATLVEERRGQTYTRDDLVAAARSAGIELEQVLADWLDATDLPGILVGEIELYRLAAGEPGAPPRYQVLLTLYNAEEVPGVARVAARVREGNASWTAADESVRLPPRTAMQVALVTDRAPEVLVVDPFLALNRTAVRVPLPSAEEEAARQAEPRQGSQPVTWSPRDEARIVDDLDESFTAEAEAARSWFRLGGGDDGATDAGLPVLTPMEGARSEWARIEVPSAYGRYRHTLALVDAGAPAAAARFVADLPEPGRWVLDVHLPVKDDLPLVARGQAWARAVLDVEAPGGGQRLFFDTAAAHHGWNEVGEIDVDEAGETVVTLRPRENASGVLVADALRWRPAPGGGGDE